MSIPANLKYTANHEWISMEGDIATVGITSHAQEELTDIVFVELPEVGRVCDSEEGIAVVELVKTASDIYAPLAGEIVQANDSLEADPALVNTDPHGKGWIFKMKINDLASLEALLNADEYLAHIGGGS